MAREAEAIREKRARIVKAEAELEASIKLTQGAKQMEGSPIALELRRMQMLSEIGIDNNTTTVILMPSDFTNAAKSFTEMVNLIEERGVEILKNKNGIIFSCCGEDKWGCRSLSRFNLLNVESLKVITPTGSATPVSNSTAWSIPYTPSMLNRSVFLTSFKLHLRGLRHCTKESICLNASVSKIRRLLVADKITAQHILFQGYFSREPYGLPQPLQAHGVITGRSPGVGVGPGNGRASCCWKAFHAPPRFTSLESSVRYRAL